VFLQFPAPLAAFGSAFPVTASNVFGTVDATSAPDTVTDRARLDFSSATLAYQEDDLYLGKSPAGSNTMILSTGHTTSLNRIE